MEHFYNKGKRIKVEIFSVGDVVSVAIPKLDRASTDMKRLPAVIVQVHGVKRLVYSLAIKYGLLKTKYAAGDIERFSGEVTPDVTTEITLREAAKREHPENKYTKGFCDCATGCQSKRCPCRVKNITCWTHCHGSNTCYNKEEPEDLGIVGPKLTQDDTIDLSTPTTYLNDNHMNAAQAILRKQLPEANGLQDTLLQQICTFKVQKGPFVQIVHSRNHWITVTRDDKVIKIYDSLRKLPDKETITLIAKYIRSEEKPWKSQ